MRIKCFAELFTPAPHRESRATEEYNPPRVRCCPIEGYVPHPRPSPTGIRSERTKSSEKNHNPETGSVRGEYNARGISYFCRQVGGHADNSESSRCQNEEWENIPKTYGRAREGKSYIRARGRGEKKEGKKMKIRDYTYIFIRPFIRFQYCDSSGTSHRLGYCAGTIFQNDEVSEQCIFPARRTTFFSFLVFPLSPSLPRLLPPAPF